VRRIKGIENDPASLRDYAHAHMDGKYSPACPGVMKGAVLGEDEANHTVIAYTNGIPTHSFLSLQCRVSNLVCVTLTTSSTLPFQRQESAKKRRTDEHIILHPLTGTAAASSNVSQISAAGKSKSNPAKTGLAYRTSCPLVRQPRCCPRQGGTSTVREYTRKQAAGDSYRKGMHK
jgi:hypothetical protein